MTTKTTDINNLYFIITWESVHQMSSSGTGWADAVDLELPRRLPGLAVGTGCWLGAQVDHRPEHLHDTSPSGLSISQRGGWAVGRRASTPGEGQESSHSSQKLDPDLHSMA